MMLVEPEAPLHSRLSNGCSFTWVFLEPMRWGPFLCPTEEPASEQPGGLSAQTLLTIHPLDKAAILHGALSSLIYSIHEPSAGPVSSRMAREEPRLQRHLLEFSEQEPVQEVEALPGSSPHPEEPQAGPAGRPSFR